MLQKPIYLDYHATTPVDPAVAEEMQPYTTEVFGNPGSRTHQYGEMANEAVKRSRATLARCINAVSANEIIFTSGATEANNIALQGAARRLKKQGKNHIITSSIEHKAVLDVLSFLETQGFDVTYICPDEDGNINVEAILDAIRPETGLLSVMHANNEIGVINDIGKIGDIAAAHNVLFHVDAAQSFGKIPLDVQSMNVHLMSISAHKIYGPKGIGALYIRKSKPRVFLEPVMFGGGQERGLRSGTLAPALIVGLAKAAELMFESQEKELRRLRELRDSLLRQLHESIGEIELNGSLENRLPNNLNVSIKGIESEALMMNLRDDIAVSNGSACTSTDWQGSYVLKSLGLSEERIASALRFGLGRYTTAEDIRLAVAAIKRGVTKLRQYA